MASLPLAFLLLFYYYPLAQLFLRHALTDKGVLTLAPLWRVLSSDYFRYLLGFTAWQALLSTLASLALGFTLAYVLTRYDFPGRQVIRSITIVPFVLPAITVALGFTVLFGHNGWLNRGLMALLGTPEPPLRILYSLWAIVLAHAFYNAPIVARLVHSAWERLDPSYEESAQALGARRRHVFLTVTLPLLTPSLLSAAALVYILCFLSFPIVLTLGGARYSTIEVEIYTRVVTLLDRQTGGALALVSLALSLLFSYGYLRLGGFFAVELGSLRGARAVRFWAGWRDLLRPAKLTLWLFAILSTVLLLGPMIAVLVDSLLKETPDGRVQFTLDWYRYIFQPNYDALIGDAPLQAVVNSFAFASGAAALALLLGLALSFVLARARFPGQRALDALTMAPLATSSVVLGFALLGAYLQPPLRISGTWLAIVLAHSVIIYPFVVRTMTPLLAQFDRTLIDAARALGARRANAFRDIELPLLATGVLVGALFAFALSLGETSATLLLARPGLKTMPIAVYSFLSARQTMGAASAMSVLMIAVSALAFVLMERWGGRALRR